jgi:hypothetical protein
VPRDLQIPKKPAAEAPRELKAVKRPNASRPKRAPKPTFKKRFHDSGDSAEEEDRSTDSTPTKRARINDDADVIKEELVF